MIKVFQSYILLSVLFFMISCGSDNAVNPEYSYIRGLYDIDDSYGGDFFDLDTVEYASSGPDYIKVGKYKFVGVWGDSADYGKHKFISIHKTQLFGGFDYTFQVKFYYIGGPGSFRMELRIVNDDGTLEKSGYVIEAISRKDR
ncbi:MAG: hypothetical protein M9949_01735 [Candidatus Kapabacteria bacterium]|nr:hypothetical protein [Candidatus Kapabacteria bacterium]